jgi:hypothetical protein
MRGAIRYASGLCSIIWILASPLSPVSANADDWVLLCEGQRLVIDLDHKDGRRDLLGSYIAIR